MQSMRGSGITRPTHYVSEEIGSLRNDTKVASTTAAPQSEDGGLTVFKHVYQSVQICEGDTINRMFLFSDGLMELKGGRVLKSSPATLPATAIAEDEEFVTFTA